MTKCAVTPIKDAIIPGFDQMSALILWWTKVWLFRLFSVSVSSYAFLFSCVPVSLFIATCMDVYIWVIVNICMASRGQEQEYSEKFQESLDHVFDIYKN